MKRKGFTLIELLAVIVVLAIMAIITIPVILKVVESTRKKASISSALNYIEAVEEYMAFNELSNPNYPIKLEEGKTYQVSSESTYVSFLDRFIDRVYAQDEVYLNNIIKVSGKKPTEGIVVIGEKNTVASARLVINGYELKCTSNSKCEVKGKVGEITSQDKVSRLTSGGLYDSKYNLIASWDDLVNTYGLNIEKDYTDSDYKTDASSGYNVLKNEALSNGVILVIPEGITSIGDNVFRDCTKIGSVKISSTVTEIGDNAFEGDSNLEIVVFEDNSQLTTIGNSAFKDNTSLEEIEIPKSVITIEDSAFEGNTNLKTVTFEDNSQLTTIGDSAFKDNTSLEEIEIPKSVTTIEDSAFEGNTNLKTVTFEDNSQLTTIGNSAFKDNTSLEEIEIPKSVITIEDSAFEGDTSLKTVTFEDNSQLATIGDSAFKDNTSLTKIEIPDSVESIGDYAFEGTDKLKNTGISDSTPPSITTTNYDIKTKSITISFVATDTESGVKDISCEYGESDSYGHKGTLSSSTTARLCTLNNLTPGKKYYFKITATNSAGTKGELTGDSVSGTFGDITISEDPSSWAKEKTITITGQTTGITNSSIEYKRLNLDRTPIDDDWKVYTSSFTINQNMVIIAHLLDGTDVSETATSTINTIDNTPPTCGTATGGNTTWKASGTVTVGVTCSDTYGECSKSEFTDTISGNGQTEEKTITISDKAGNTNTCTNTYNKYIDTVAPTTPTAGAIGEVSGSSTTGSIQTEASGSTDTGGSGEISYLYLVTNSNSTPANTNTSFTTSRNFTRSCGTSYYAWAIAVDKVGNRSGVYSLGNTADGADVYQSSWSACSAACGTGTQTKTNTCALKTTLSQNCNTQTCVRYKFGNITSSTDGYDSFSAAGCSTSKPCVKFTFNSSGTVTKKEVCGYVNSKYFCLTNGSSYYSANVSTLQGLGVSCGSTSSYIRCPDLDLPRGRATTGGGVYYDVTRSTGCRIYESGSVSCSI